MNYPDNRRALTDYYLQYDLDVLSDSNAIDIQKERDDLFDALQKMPKYNGLQSWCYGCGVVRGFNVHRTGCIVKHAETLIARIKKGTSNDEP